MRIQQYQAAAACPYPRGSRRALAEAVSQLCRDVERVSDDLLEQPMVDLVKLTQALGVCLHDLAAIATVAGVSLEAAARRNLAPESADGGDAA